MHPVGRAPVGVVDGEVGDLDVGQGDAFVLRNVNEPHVGPHDVEGHGKVRRLHLRGQRFADAWLVVVHLHPVHVDVVAGDKRGGEKGKPLDMIPMSMANQQCTCNTVGVLSKQRLT